MHVVERLAAWAECYRAAKEVSGYESPATRELMGRIEVAIDPELDAAFPKQRAARVAFRTRDGREEEFLQPTRIGDPEALLQRVWKLETEKSLAP
jgi:2-methylcitrate dehydratase PrpD